MDLIINAIEFKFQWFTNFKLNSLMFPNHKNAATGKTTTSTATHGMAMLFDSIYLASNPDSNIIKSDLLIDQYRNFVWLKRLS